MNKTKSHEFLGQEKMVFLDGSPSPKLCMGVRTYAAVRTKIKRFSFIWRLEARQSLDLVVLAHWSKLREGQVYCKLTSRVTVIVTRSLL